MKAEKKSVKSAGALDTTKKAVAKGLALDAYVPPKSGGNKQSYMGSGGVRPGSTKKGY